MNTAKILWELVSPFESHTEDLLVVCWRWLIKKKYGSEKFADVVAVGAAEDKTLYIKGFCPLAIGPQTKNPGRVLRSMLQGRLVAEKGPMPALNTHQLVLFPLPSLWLRYGLTKITKLINDWNGITEAFGVPFCLYTTMR